MNRPKLRQVLECASPLALFQRRRANQKRQRAAAVQDAVAPNWAHLGSVPMLARFWDWRLPVVERRGMNRKEHSAAEPQSNTSRGEGRGMDGRGMKAGEPCS